MAAADTAPFDWHYVLSAVVFIAVFLTIIALIVGPSWLRARRMLRGLSRPKADQPTHVRIVSEQEVRNG